MRPFILALWHFILTPVHTALWVVRHIPQALHFIMYSPWHFWHFCTRTATFLGKVWHLSAPFFAHSPERWRARALLLSIIALNLIAVYFLVLINEWNRVFYDALQNKNQAVFWHELGRFIYLAFGFVIVAVYKFYLNQLLHLRWRSFMTQYYLTAWMRDSVFFKIHVQQHLNAQSATANGHDNPDQRIQEDVENFCSQTLSLSMGLLNATVTLVSFVGILWSLSGPFDLHIANSTYSIDGFLVWSALAYALLGTVIAHLIGARLVPLNFMQQRLEALFRHEMGRVREHADTIATERSAPALRTHLGNHFSDVLANYYKLIAKQKQLTWFTVSFGQASVVFPFIVSAPRYFSGAIALGGLMQIASAFGRVLDALTWFVDAYSQIASWRATTDRLTSFDELIHQSTPFNSSTDRTTGSTHTPSTVQVQRLQQHLQLPTLQLQLPNGQPLFNFQGATLTAGAHTLLRAPSGFGKSTLFKALSGCWHWHQPLSPPTPSSEDSKPDHLDASAQTAPTNVPLSLLFCAQKPFFPTGTLRYALTYMLDQPERITDEQLREALQLCAMPSFFERLDQTAPWMQVLSGGEAQRLNCVKIFLQPVDVLFLDEITSSLDADSEKHLYGNIMQFATRHGTHVISIAHKESAALWHSQILDLQPLEPSAPLTSKT